MDDIATLEGRITAALDRIRAGLAKAEPTVAEGESPALAQQLDEERTANAQLQERVRALKERQDGQVAELETRVAGQKDRIAALEGEVERLQAALAEQREMAEKLRDAADGEGPDAELVNKALMAEIDTLKSQRATDAAEVAQILRELKPLVEGA